MKQIRTDFKTQAITQRYIFECQERFPHFDFSMVTEIPEFRRNALLEIFKKTRDNGFSYEY